MCKEKKMCLIQPLAYIDYMPPKLTRGKVWYVSYKVRNPLTKKFKRFRIKVNHFGSASERISAARNVMANLEHRLSLGWSPFTERSAPKAYVRISDAMESFMKVKRKELEANSLRSYSSFIKIFSDWLERSGLGKDAPVISIDASVAVRFMSEVEGRPDVSPRTFNNYQRFFFLIFDWMRVRGYVSENPFSGIQRKPKRLLLKTRRMMTDKELESVFSFLKKANPEYCAAALLCYCCFIRPKEIVLLRCGDVDLTNKLVHVKAEISKNHRDSFRTIPYEAIPFFESMNLGNKESFLFGDHKEYDFHPGKIQMCSRKLAKYWSEKVRPACGLPQEVQFYSLKDTGITNMLSSGVPINEVQRQADHTSVAVTAIYVGKTCPKANKLLQDVNLIPIKY